MLSVKRGRPQGHHYKALLSVGSCLRCAGRRLPAAAPAATAFGAGTWDLGSGIRAASFGSRAASPGRRLPRAASKIAVVLASGGLARWSARPLGRDTWGHGTRCALSTAISASSAAAATSTGAATSTIAASQYDRVAIAQTRRARRDDTITIGEAIEDLRTLVAFDADLHGVEGRHVVDRKVHATRPAGVDQSIRWHDERIGVRLGDDADARVHPGLQPVLIVWNLDLDRRGARGWIKHGRQARDPPHEAFPGIRIDLDAGRIADADLLQVLLDDVGDEPDMHDIDDVDDRRVGGDECARI